MGMFLQKTSRPSPFLCPLTRLVGPHRSRTAALFKKEAVSACVVVVVVAVVVVV